MIGAANILPTMFAYGSAFLNVVQLVVAPKSSRCYMAKDFLLLVTKLVEDCFKHFIVYFVKLAYKGTFFSRRNSSSPSGDTKDCSFEVLPGHIPHVYWGLVLSVQHEVVIHSVPKFRKIIYKQGERPNRSDIIQRVVYIVFPLRDTKNDIFVGIVFDSYFVPFENEIYKPPSVLVFGN